MNERAYARGQKYTLSLDPDEVEALLALEHSNPHAILGPHEVEHRYQRFTVIRAFFPECGDVTIALRPRGKRWFERLPMKLIHPMGLFELQIPGPMKVDYHFEFRESDGAISRFEDPYRFRPTLESVDAQDATRLGNSGLGPRFIEHEGVAGFAFGVLEPLAKQVSLVGEFNLWDARKHMMRRMSASGLWEIFVPFLEPGEPYKLEIKRQDGEISLETDPWAPTCLLHKEPCSTTPRD